MTHNYVDLVVIKEAGGIGIFEAPAWKVDDGDIATVFLSGICGGQKECHVKNHLTVSKDSDVYRFLEALNGGKIEKVKCLYHKEEIEVAE
jgi:hypothetical protein